MKKNALPEKKSARPCRENPGYAYEKRAPPYVGMPPVPEWLIRPGDVYGAAGSSNST